MPELLFDSSNHPEVTFDEAFLLPTNSVMHRLNQQANSQEIQELGRLFDISERAELDSSAYIQQNKRRNTDLAKKARAAHKEFRSYVLYLAEQYPDVEKVVSRDQVDIASPDGMLQTPLVVANMSQAAGKRQAEKVGMMGGLSAFTQDEPLDYMQNAVNYLHSRPVEQVGEDTIVHDTPVVISKDTKVHELRRLVQKRDLDTAIVTDDQNKIVGIVRLQTRIGKPENGHVVLKPGIVPNSANDDWSVEQFLRTENIVTVKRGTSREEAIATMEDKHEFLPVVNDDDTLHAAWMLKTAAYGTRYKPNISDLGGLKVMAAAPAITRDSRERVQALLDMGIDVLLLDTAHFDQGTRGYKNLREAKKLIEKTGRNIPIVAGNVVTKEATKNLLSDGADVVKVGVGPGAMCTTRMETGVGRPQLSAILECAEAADAVGGEIMADGGIRYPRDVALALAGGASSAMMGTVFVPTYESPAELHTDERGVFATNQGMASRNASMMRTYKLESAFRRIIGHRAEGISGAKVYRKSGQHSSADIMHNVMDGVTSSVTYAGARSIEEFRRFARIGIQSISGFSEGAAKPIS